MLGEIMPPSCMYGRLLRQPHKTIRERPAREREREIEDRHGADGEVGEVAGDAEPGTGVGVARTPAPQQLVGGVEAQLELQESLPCQSTKKNQIKRTFNNSAKLPSVTSYHRESMRRRSAAG